MKNKETNYFENENLSVKEWCNKLVDEGHTLTLLWEGGGDSGWTHFEIDGVEVDNNYTRALVDYCYDVLDYGSWAGEFQSNGSAEYSKSEGAFMGVDDYSEDDIQSWDCKIQIKIPKTIWFDRLLLHLQEDTSKVYFEVENGFLTDNHQILQNAIAKKVSKEVNEEINNFSRQNNFINIDQEIRLLRSEFQETSDGHLLKEIENLEMYASDSTEKDIYVQVDENVEDVFKSMNNESKEK